MCVCLLFSAMQINIRSKCMIYINIKCMIFIFHYNTVKPQSYETQSYKLTDCSAEQGMNPEIA